MKLSTSQFRGLVESLNIKPDEQDIGIGIQEGTWPGEHGTCRTLPKHHRFSVSGGKQSSEKVTWTFRSVLVICIVTEKSEGV